MYRQLYSWQDATFALSILLQRHQTYPCWVLKYLLSNREDSPKGKNKSTACFLSTNTRSNPNVY